MSEIQDKIVAKSRGESGKGIARKLRAEGRAPAVVYGPDMEPKHLSVDATDLVRTRREFGSTHVYNVEVINNFIWFCLTDHNSVNQIKILDFNGSEVQSYDVEIAPGDIATWQKTH